MQALRDVKILIDDEDYKTLSALARLHGRRIYEELAMAVREHNSKYACMESRPLLEPYDWLNMQQVSPYDFSDSVYSVVRKVYPDMTREQFEDVQHRRQPGQEHTAAPQNN